MEETIQLFYRYLQKVWYRRRLVTTTTIAFCLLGWVAITFVDDQFEASARVIVDTKTMLSRSLKGLAVESEDVQGELLNAARAQLLNRNTIDRLITQNNLDLTVSTEEQRQALRSSVLSKTTIEAQRTNSSNNRAPEDIIELRYVSSDPNIAYNSVSTLLNTFLETVLGSSQSGNAATERFLQRKVDEYKATLEVAEDRLKDFKRRNIGMLPGEGQDYFREFSQLKKDLQDTELESTEALNLKVELESQIRNLSNSGAQGQGLGTLASARNEKINELEARLLDSLLVYTQDHPDVVALKRTLADLKRSDVGDLSDRELLNAASLSGNRVVEELRVELGKTEASYAAKQARLEEYRKRLIKMERAINTVPEIEAEYTRLTRDYDTNKDSYDELLKRLQSARLSKARDVSAGEVSFNVIEPPTVPVIPTKPNRSLLATTVLILGIAAGLIAGLLMNVISPRFSDSRELEEHFGLSVLGSVVFNTLDVEASRQNVMMYAGVFGLLFGAYIIYLLVVV